jgi:TonB-linked SusC/RagA family outer membrane protein
MRRIIFLLVAMFIGLQAFAQTTISGTVTDENGEPVPGANVRAKGFSDVGTITDLNGGYSFNIPAEATTLVISFVGMETKEVEINGQTVINVTLENEDVGIGEVVITGYAVKDKKVASSAISVVGADDLAEMSPITSVDNMLQGKAAGVDVTSLNGKPGSTASVKVRGAISLNSTGGDKSQPLYVVDGIPMDNSSMNAVNASDIETLTVLKDASASAIYGSRAANGVVVITTKQGKEGSKAIITYNGRFGFANKIDDPYDMMNAAQKIELNEAVGLTYTDEARAELLSYDHNWQDDILKQATIMSHSVSARGGNANTTYFVSGALDKNTGIVQKLDGFERFTGRVNLVSRLSEKLNIAVTTSVSQTSSDEPRDRNNVQNPFRAMYDYNAYTPVYVRNADGSIYLDDNGKPEYSLTAQGFPILEALENNPESEQFTYLIGSAKASYDIIEGLELSTKYSANYRRYKREYYNMPNSVLDGYVGDPAAPGSKTDGGSDWFVYTWTNQLSYGGTFGDHNISASAFTEFYKEKWHSYSLGSKGYANSQLTTQDNSAEATDATTSRSDAALFSIAGFVDYDFQGKYLASASVRRDGASRFGKDKRYGVFWSASLGWNIAEEDFLSSVSFLDDLKLIASYGTIGSWDFGNYDSQGGYTFASYDGQTAAIIKGTVGNPELTWEAQKSLNIGLESSFLENRVNATIDYFINTRTDFLFENPLPYEGGGYSQWRNSGELVIKGLEISLDGDVIRNNDLKWNIGANIAFLNYEVTELEQEQLVESTISIIKEGEEPWTFYLPRYAGVNPSNGDALYYTADGEVTNVFSSGDNVILTGKSPLPEFYGGFNTYVSYKGIDFTADFAYKYGNYTYNYMTYNQLADGDYGGANQRVEALQYWKQPGDNYLPRLNGNSNQVTDRFLQDASYIRLRNVSLGYTLPKKWVDAVKLAKVRIFAQGQNLYTWTKFEGDPEVSVGSGENQLGAGQKFIPGLYSLYSYPAIRTFLFGIEVKF